MTNGSLRIAIIGGSGLEARLFSDLTLTDTERHELDTPFGRPSSPIITGTERGVPIALLSRHGDGHILNPAAVPYRANVFALKMLGCTHIVAFGATGSLREEIGLGDLVICDQLIDRTDGRTRTFYEQSAVHVEFAEPFCSVTRGWLHEAATRVDGVGVHDKGCYMCMEGPAFSTRAESHMHRMMGADVVGMTAQPEARLAREAEIAYAMVALPTDYDCWRPRADGDPDSVLAEIIGNLNRSTDASIRLLEAALGDVEALKSTPSPAHDALARSIWSDKAKIDPREVERLRPLWGRYF
jgi:5'-methylthioadenosine phosphorylase